MKTSSGICFTRRTPQMLLKYILSRRIKNSTQSSFLAIIINHVWLYSLRASIGDKTNDRKFCLHCSLCTRTDSPRNCQFLYLKRWHMWPLAITYDFGSETTLTLSLVGLWHLQYCHQRHENQRHRCCSLCSRCAPLVGTETEVKDTCILQTAYCILQPYLLLTIVQCPRNSTCIW